MRLAELQDGAFVPVELSLDTIEMQLRELDRLVLPAAFASSDRANDTRRIHYP